MEKTRKELIERKIELMPTSFRNVYKKAIESRSKAAAIKAFCAECCGYDRTAVKECTGMECPLWTHRPYQEK